METKTILRAKLLDNVAQMCKYAERELADINPNEFRYKYAHGFTYGYSNYHIAFSYNPNTRCAEMSVNYYQGHDYYIKNGKVYDSGKDITDRFVNDKGGCTCDEIEKAMIITMQEWSRIKSKIAEHNHEFKDIMNFTI